MVVHVFQRGIQETVVFKTIFLSCLFLPPLLPPLNGVVLLWAVGSFLCFNDGLCLMILFASFPSPAWSWTLSLLQSFVPPTPADSRHVAVGWFEEAAAGSWQPGKSDQKVLKNLRFIFWTGITWNCPCGAQAQAWRPEDECIQISIWNHHLINIRYPFPLVRQTISFTWRHEEGIEKPGR